MTRVRLIFFPSRRRYSRYWRDWSSDVCSSDLRDRQTALERCRARQDEVTAVVRQAGDAVESAETNGVGVHLEHFHEIGRAVWRESVKITVDGVSVKNIISIYL